MIFCTVFPEAGYLILYEVQVLPVCALFTALWWTKNSEQPLDHISAKTALFRISKYGITAQLTGSYHRQTDLERGYFEIMVLGNDKQSLLFQQTLQSHKTSQLIIH